MPNLGINYLSTQLHFTQQYFGLAGEIEIVLLLSNLV